MMSGIIPRSKAKGTDICAINKYYYIIRSDLGCYMKTRCINKGADLSIFSLHPACQNGDHYLGDWKGYFHIIKGNSCRTVTDLTTDSNAAVYSLHPNCQGGDHYLGARDKFYIIFQERGTYRKTTNMNLDSDAEEHPLNPRDGLYYWGPPYSKQGERINLQDLISMSLVYPYHEFYVLKPSSEWGVEFCPLNSRYDITEGKRAVYSVHPDVINFLPGGLSVTQGPAFGIWENIKTIDNDSNIAMTWQKKITKKVGYNKEKLTQITHNWNIALSASIETGALVKLITKAQFSLSAEYGGSRVDTTNEIRNEATEEEEQLTFELKPKESVYLWQYKLGLGEEPVLFCRDLKITSDPNPPTEVPLPPAK